MKITFVLANADMSGGVRVVADHARYLHHHGHTVTVVAAQPAAGPLRRRVRSWLGGHGWSAASWRRPSHIDTLPLNVRRLSPGKSVTAADVPDADAIIGTWWRTMEWIMPLPPQKGVRIHFVQGHETFASQPIDRVEAVYRLAVPKIAVSSWLVDVMARQYDQRDVTLALNGIDTSHFSAPPRERGTPPAVGFIYSRSAMKRTGNVIEACRLAARRLPGLQVRCFGPFAPTRDLPLPHGTTMVQNPDQSAIPGLYAAAHAWLIGSNSEGFSLPAVEAMACRTPVVGTPVGAVPELVKDGAGLIVPHDDPRAMAAAIETILTMPADRWRTMSQAARRAAETYDHRAAARRFEAAVQRIVERDRAAMPHMN
jgi:glycosyltransferase involved in cell wall biosynthesis